jgi:hypothetical protein
VTTTIVEIVCPYQTCSTAFGICVVIVSFNANSRLTAGSPAELGKESLHAINVQLLDDVLDGF